MTKNSASVPSKLCWQGNISYLRYSFWGFSSFCNFSHRSRSWHAARLEPVDKVGLELGDIESELALARVEGFGALQLVFRPRSRGLVRAHEEQVDAVVWKCGKSGLKFANVKTLSWDSPRSTITFFSSGIIFSMKNCHSKAGGTQGYFYLWNKGLETLSYPPPPCQFWLSFTSSCSY